MTGIPSPEINQRAHPRARRRHPVGAGQGTREARLLTTGTVAAVILILAFRGGAADVVVRQEMSIVLLWGIALLVLFGALPRTRPGVDGRRLLTAGGALALLTGLSLLWGHSTELGLVELNRVVFYVAIVALILLCIGRETWQAAAAGLAFAVLLVPIASILSRLAPDTFDALGIDVFAFRRLLYPLGYWNAVGAWAAMALAVGVAYSAHLRAGVWRTLSLAATPAAGATVYLTYSRGATVAALVGLAVVAIVARHRGTSAIHALAALLGSAGVVVAIRSNLEVANGTGTAGAAVVGLVLLVASSACAFVAARTAGSAWGRARWVARRSGGVALAVTAIGVVVALALGGSGAASQVEQDAAIGYPAERSDPAARLTNLESGRYEIWDSAIRAFASAPVLGIGAGGFEFWWGAHDEESESLQNAHSLYLEAAAELGFAGFAIVVVLVGLALLACVKARGRAQSAADAGASTALLALGAVFALSAGIDWVWELPALSAVGLAAAAIAASSASTPRARDRRLSKERFVAAILALAAGAAQIPGTVAQQRIRASEAKIAIGDTQGGIEDADEAVSAAPWAASPYAQLALAQAAAGNVRDALRNVRSAIEREPLNWRHYALLSQVQARRGEIEPALASLGRAAELSPLSGETFAEIEASLRTTAAQALAENSN